MNEAARQQEHRNLYYIFQIDQAEHSMPEEKRKEVLNLIQCRIKTKIKGESQ